MGHSHSKSRGGGGAGTGGGGGTSGGPSQIDARVVRELAKILSETGLTEIEVERGELRVRVARNAAREVTYAAAPLAAAPAEQPVPAAAAQVAAAAAGDATPAGGVTSPMVGTAFLAPEPGADPFVTIGQQVKKGDTLVLIEAMKTFNPVTAPAAGKVTAILVEDGQPVEFGEPLVVIG